MLANDSNRHIRMPAGGAVNQMFLVHRNCGRDALFSHVIFKGADHDRSRGHSVCCGSQLGLAAQPHGADGGWHARFANIDIEVGFHGGAI